MKSEWSYHLNGVVKFKPYSFYEKAYDTCAMFYNEKGENIVLCFDTCQNCCEDFNLDYNKKFHTKEVVSETGITVSCHRVKKFRCECGDKYIFFVDTGKKIYQIAVSNDHNGYYGHYVGISKNGEFVWETCIQGLTTPIPYAILIM